jgi:hypothetical protein
MAALEEGRHVPVKPLPPLPKFTCGLCGFTFGTNFRTEEIECPECEARRCPHCETWFGSQL